MISQPAQGSLGQFPHSSRNAKKSFHLLTSWRPLAGVWFSMCGFFFRCKSITDTSKTSLGLYCGTTLVLGWLCNSGILAGGFVIKMRLHQVLLLLSGWWELRETYEILTNNDKIEPNRISKKRIWSGVDWRYRSIWSSLKRSVKKNHLVCSLLIYVWWTFPGWWLTFYLFLAPGILKNIKYEEISGTLANWLALACPTGLSQ